MPEGTFEQKMVYTPTGKRPKDILDVLLEKRLIYQTQVDHIREKAPKIGKSVDEILEEGNFIPDKTLANAYSDLYDLPFVDLEKIHIPYNVISIIPENIAKTHLIASFEITDNIIKIAVAKPYRLQAQEPGLIDKLQKKSKFEVQLYIATMASIRYALQSYKQKPSASKKVEVRPQPSPKNLNSEVPEKPKTRQRNILDVLITQDLISPKEYQEFKSQSERSGKTYEDFIREKGMLNSEDFERALGILYKIPFIRLKGIDIPYEVLSKFPQNIAENYNMVVFEAIGNNALKVATSYPDNPQIHEILNFVRERNEIEIDLFVTTPEDIKEVLIGYQKEQKRVQDQEEKQKQEKQKKFEAIQNTQAIEQTLQTGENLPQQTLPQPQQPPQPPQGITTLIPQSQQINLQPGYEHQLQEQQNIQAPQSQPQAQQPQEQGDDQGILTEIIKEPLKEIKTKPETEVSEHKRIKIVEQTGEIDLGRLINQDIQSLEELQQIIASGMVPKICAAIINFALVKKASDIHIEPAEDYVRVRYRIDGILREIVQIPIDLHPALISRIKISARLRIDEQRIPQDGRFDVVFHQGAVDIRVSSLPTVRGEKIVMRLLDKGRGIISLEKLGLRGHAFDILVENVKKPYGMVLATGPTGSGKTTTLYAVIQFINSSEINIVTLEDPVEYEIEGINHSQARPEIGYSFANGLRSVLRQDPNVIMVGEIRDKETAGMAIHAALTGHLVLSSLHTNDAPGAIPRLIDMGVEPFLITSSANVIIAQRLVRLLCERCREKVSIPPEILSHIEQELGQITPAAKVTIKRPLQFYRGRGCDECTQGYKGRIGIYEILPITIKIQELTNKKSSGAEIKKWALQEGMITMKQDGILKALDGITSVDEVLRVTLTE